MARDQAALLDRVKKLLALATSPNVHEAAAAAARAQALIEEHRLQSLLQEDDDQTDPVTDGRDAPLEASRRLRRWKILLATILGEHNGCVAYTQPRGALTALLLAGRAADRAAVHAIWAWLVVRIELLSASEGDDDGPRFHGDRRDRRWHEAFRIGAAEVVAERLATATTEVRAALPQQALVRVEPALAARAAAVDRFVAAELRLQPGRRLLVDVEAYERGRAAGARLPLKTSASNRS